MRNIADSEAYTVFDHVFSKTVRSLSAVVGLKRITQPFWNRWLASGVSPDVIFQFLDGVGTIDNWAGTAEAVVARERLAFERARSQLSEEQQIEGLRRLSYLCHMAQWGCLPITEQRRKLYALSRDFYIEAESLVHGSLYRRLAFTWRGNSFYGNLHLREERSPLVAIVHGIDGCKEEHLATELALLEAGFATLCFDGPGQAEALLLSDIRWEQDFHLAISAALDAALSQPEVDHSHIGLLGISIGGMWALQAAAADTRIGAVFDLGAPLHTRRFPSLPFLIKTRLCQVTGARTQSEVAAVLDQNNIEAPDLLASIQAHVCMVHGGRDRVVSVADKQWLRDQLLRSNASREVSLKVIATGDHCCTGHFEEVRGEAIAFFRRHFLATR